MIVYNLDSHEQWQALKIDTAPNKQIGDLIVSWTGISTPDLASSFCGAGSQRPSV